MLRPDDTPLIMMVAQKPFEHDFNQFCKLIPKLYVDGTEPELSDFPNDGEIWWMLTAQTAGLAQPGRLVAGIVEDAVRYKVDDPSSSKFQVKRDSARDLQVKDGMVVINLRGDSIDSMPDLVLGGAKVLLTVPPTPQVMLRWRSHVYGPFIATRSTSDGDWMQETFAFTPANTTELTVYQIDDLAFTEATKGYRFPVTDDVSRTTWRRSEKHQLAQVNHDLVLGRGYERVLATHPQKLVLEPIDRALVRIARQIMSRKKCQQLRQLLSELELKSLESDATKDLVNTVTRIKSRIENQDEALHSVVMALTEAGLLGADRIEKAEKAFAEKYIQERTAELQAKVDENIKEKREELRQVEGQLKDHQANLKTEGARLRAKLEQELELEREKARLAIAAEREEFESQRNEFKGLQEALTKNLSEVTKELRDAGDGVVNRFLTIAPLLGIRGFATEAVAHDKPAAAPEEKSAAATPTFRMPEFIHAHMISTEQDLSEQAFIDRFLRLVENNGFTYRPLDLQRFHLSVKCGELTVLGGPSGTGKSSLASLYAQALLGEEAGAGRPGCLMVNVNPSWMEIRDLLGHMNTLEGRFYPAESGLFQHLIYAQEEHGHRGTRTGLYLVCLDEMNLSQVEHYFSDFMMVLERDSTNRFIQCFAPGQAGAKCAFRDWGRINLSPALRFVGTVNFDETTRLLSDRFLDRVNLIRLTSTALPAVALPSLNLYANAGGRMVTLADFEAWRRDSPLPPALGALLDQMRPLLNQMGCPVSPRVYRAICRFVSSAAGVLSPEKAFDVQVAQRVVPKIRSLITKRQLSALDEITKLFNESSLCNFDEATPLLEEARESFTKRGWELDE